MSEYRPILCKCGLISGLHSIRRPLDNCDEFQADPRSGCDKSWAVERKHQERERKRKLRNEKAFKSSEIKRLERELKKLKA